MRRTSRASTSRTATEAVQRLFDALILFGRSLRVARRATGATSTRELSRGDIVTLGVLAARGQHPSRPGRRDARRRPLGGQPPARRARPARPDRARAPTPRTGAPSWSASPPPGRERLGRGPRRACARRSPSGSPPGTAAEIDQVADILDDLDRATPEPTHTRTARQHHACHEDQPCLSSTTARPARGRDDPPRDRRGARRPDVGAVRGDRQRDDRLHRAADDHRRPQRQPDPVHLGGHRLAAGDDGEQPDLEQVLRPLQQEAAGPARDRRLPGRLAGRRRRAERARAARRPRGPGPRHGRPGRARPVDHRLDHPAA